MKTVNIREAKAQLSKLVEQAAKGKSFIIAKAGTPLVKVTSLDVPTQGQNRHLGFMAGHISVPDDFDHMGRGEIEMLFCTDSQSTAEVQTAQTPGPIRKL